jgi:hypothetical protein
MTINELVLAIARKHENDHFKLLEPPSNAEILNFEKFIGFGLPQDFRTFYGICNGFEMDEDMFRMIPVEEIIASQVNRKERTFDFAEYMLYSDFWALKFFGNSLYKIVNTGGNGGVLGSDLSEFLQRFLTGGVFEPGGLYDWHDETKR